MADIKRISVQQAHAKTNAKQALLVCAYEDEAKCRMFNLEGSISFSKFQPHSASLPKTQEIIFYGAGPGEASAVGQAAKYQAQGFTNVKVLKGGVEAWKAAGYAMNGSLATIAERISHSHPALTVAGTTRIEHPCGTCGDRDATDFFLFRFTYSHSSADTAPTFPVQ